jgi:hypothetical protein
VSVSLVGEVIGIILWWDSAIAVTTASPEPEPSRAGPRNSRSSHRQGLTYGRFRASASMSGPLLSCGMKAS